MNTKLNKRSVWTSMIFTIAVVMYLSSDIKAQSPGLVVQYGIVSAYSKDVSVTQPNQAHYGWLVNADARLLSDDLYFIIGGQYQNMSVQSTSSPEFFNNNDWAMANLRFGLGANFLRLNRVAALRTKLLASVNFTIQAPNNGIGVSGYEKMNDSFMGATTGIGITIGPLDVDFDFQYGFINAYYKQPDTTFDMWSLMFGFHF